MIKKSKTTYTVTMKGFYLPEKQKSMDNSLLPDQKIIDIIKEDTVMPITNENANAEVFSKFMDVQLSQMKAASEMLSKATTESEKQNILNCITLFQNNAMRAYEAYFGNQAVAPVTFTAPMAVAAPAPVVEMPAPVVEEIPAPAPAGVDVYEIFVSAIADKTGYPTDMIDETMELESDLGIDSIKRVEIFAAVFTALDRSLTPDEIGELSDLTDIQSIVAYLTEKI